MPIATGHEREELEAELEVIALYTYVYMRFRYDTSLFFWHSGVIMSVVLQIRSSLLDSGIPIDVVVSS